MHKWMVVLIGSMLPIMSVTAENRLPADPTRPSLAALTVQAEKNESVEYVLNALRFGGKRSVAVINGQRVKAGDSIGMARVHSITAKGVRLSIGTEQQFLSLAERKGFSKVKSGK